MPTDTELSAALLKSHPFAKIFPLLNGAEFKRLVANVKARGLREPIVLYEGMILDGRNRYRACLSAKANVLTRNFEGDDHPARAFVFSQNICRRHLKPQELHKIIAGLLKAEPEKSDRQIAEQAKVDHHKVAKIRKQEADVGKIPHVEKRTDTKGRKQPAKKPKQANTERNRKAAEYRAKKREERRAKAEAEYQAKKAEIKAKAERLAADLIESDRNLAQRVNDFLWDGYSYELELALKQQLDEAGGHDA